MLWKKCQEDLQFLEGRLAEEESAESLQISAELGFN